MKLALSLCIILGATYAAAQKFTKSFKIENNRFMKDGKPVLIKAGAMHYSRVPREYWTDRLLRMRAMGLNAVQTYVPWNFHEEKRGEYNFEGLWDIGQFLEEAQNAGMMVVLRIGPYMCGEWEFGGLPAWLLENGTIPLRTAEEPYFSAAMSWMLELSENVVEFLYPLGGPIVMIQIENEFGSYGDVTKNPKEKVYIESLVKFWRSAVDDSVPLFTTDGGNLASMMRGSLNGSSVLTVGDGCGDPRQCWEAQAQMNPPGMQARFVSEFYPGWLTHWGEKMANTSSKDTAKHAEMILSTNGSITLYMAHGGTSWGFWSGANGNGNASYQADITSYDYDAPISEGGNHGYGCDGLDKFEALTEVFYKYWDPEVDGSDLPPDEPAGPFFTALLKGDRVYLEQESPMLSSDSITTLAYNHAPVNTQGKQPEPVEKYGCYYGFSWYTCDVAVGLGPGANLSLADVPRDRAHIFFGGELQGIIYRADLSSYYITAKNGVNEHDRVALLVENMGRINFAHGMDDTRKGLLGPLYADDAPISCFGWNTTCLPLTSNSIDNLKFHPTDQPGSSLPAFFKTDIKAGANEEHKDTFLDMTGWGKGYVWVNGILLGRYWADGPQRTLYVPAPLWDGNTLELVVLELDSSRADRTVRFVNHNIFSGEV